MSEAIYLLFLCAFTVCTGGTSHFIFTFLSLKIRTTAIFIVTDDILYTMCWHVTISLCTSQLWSSSINIKKISACPQCHYYLFCQNTTLKKTVHTSNILKYIISRSQTKRVSVTPASEACVSMMLLKGTDTEKSL
jgi:hypothetical protein